MKIDRISSDKLKSQIKSRFKSKGMSFATIGRLAGVHPSQVSRICSGEFRTLSHNVVQVCGVIGIELDTVSFPHGERELLAKNLEARLHRLWQHDIPKGRKLLKVLDSLASLRGKAQA